MAESFVQVNVPVTAGKKLKTWESVDGGGNVVESEAVTLTDATGDEVVIYPDATTLNNGAQAVVGVVAIEVLIANPARVEAVIQNTGTSPIRIGVVGLTSTTGIQLQPGASVVFSMPFVFTGAVYAIRDSTAIVDGVVLALEAT